MECIKLDFDVLETRDPRKLKIEDSSRNWLHAIDLPAYLYITLPGSTQAKIFDFVKGSVRTFTAEDLELSSPKCSDLPDGIYKIKLQSGFEEHYVEKYYLKTDLLEQEISKGLIKNALNLSSDSDAYVESVFNVDWKLMVAKAFARECNIPMATRYYNEALQGLNCG